MLWRIGVMPVRLRDMLPIELASATQHALSTSPLVGIITEDIWAKYLTGLAVHPVTRE